MKFRVHLSRDYINMEVGSIVVEANSKVEARRKVRAMLEVDDLEDSAHWHATDSFVVGPKIREIEPIDK